MTANPEVRENYLGWLADKLEVEVMDDSDLHGPSPRIPFVSPMLTWATTGGVKLGQICRWYGNEGSGKSLTNLGLMVMAQRFPQVLEETYERKIKLLERKKGSKLARVKLNKDLKFLQAKYPDPLSILFIDAEGRFEPELAKQVGVKLGKDSCFPIFESIIENVCEIAQGAFQERAYDIVIVDSATICESIESANKAPGEYEQGADPRAWKRLKRVSRAMRRHGGTLILVDQVRTQLGQARGGRGGTPVTPPNVRIFRHMASLSMEYEQGKKLYLDKKGMLTDDYEKASDEYPALGTNGKEPHGLEMRCFVQKNSTGRPFRHSRMRFQFPAMNRDGELVQDIGFDEAFELAESGIDFGMIEKKGSYYYRLDDRGKRTKHKVMHGDAALKNKILEDEEWADAIRQRLFVMT